MNTKLVLISLGVALCIAAPVQARDKDHHRRVGNQYRDFAQVIDVQPVFRSVSVPQTAQECWNEQVNQPVRRQVRSNDTAGATVVGGIIGGAMGKHFGGRDPAAVVAGTLLGAAIAHDAASHSQQRNEYVVVEQRRCHEYTEYRQEEQQDGYIVTYRYEGEIFTAHMNSHPGRRIRVKVSVEPIFE